MKTYLQPLSEEFIYGSPEKPVVASYRLILALDVEDLESTEKQAERGLDDE